MGANTSRYDKLFADATERVEMLRKRLQEGIAPSRPETEEMADLLARLRDEYETLRERALEEATGIIEFDRESDLGFLAYCKLIEESAEARARAALDKEKKLINDFLSVYSEGTEYLDALKSIREQADRDLAALQDGGRENDEEVIRRSRMRELFLEAIDVASEDASQVTKTLDDLSDYLPTGPTGFKIYQGLLLGRYVMRESDTSPSPVPMERVDSEAEIIETSANDVPSDEIEDVPSKTVYTFREDDSVTPTFNSVASFIEALHEDVPIAVRFILPLLSGTIMLTGRHIRILGTKWVGRRIVAIEQALSYLVKSGMVARLSSDNPSVAYSLTKECRSYITRRQVRKLRDRNGKSYWDMAITDVARQTPYWADADAVAVSNCLSDWELTTNLLADLSPEYIDSLQEDHSPITLCVFDDDEGHVHRVSVLFATGQTKQELELCAREQEPTWQLDGVIFVTGPVDAISVPKGFKGRVLQALDGRIVAVTEQDNEMSPVESIEDVEGHDAIPPTNEPDTQGVDQEGSSTTNKNASLSVTDIKPQEMQDRGTTDGKTITSDDKLPVPIEDPKPLKIETAKQFKRELNRRGTPVGIRTILSALTTDVWYTEAQLVCNGEFFGQSEDDILSAIAYLLEKGLVARYSVGEYDEVLSLTQGGRKLMTMESIMHAKAGGRPYWVPSFERNDIPNLAGQSGAAALNRLRQMDAFCLYYRTVISNPPQELKTERHGRTDLHLGTHYDGAHFSILYPSGGEVKKFVILSPTDNVPDDAKNLLFAPGPAPVDNIDMSSKGDVLQIIDGEIEPVQRVGEIMSIDNTVDARSQLKYTKGSTPSATKASAAKDEGVWGDIDELTVEATASESGASDLKATDNETRVRETAEVVVGSDTLAVPGCCDPVEAASKWVESSAPPSDDEMLGLAMALGNGFLPQEVDTDGFIGMAVSYTLLASASLHESYTSCSTEFRRLDLATRLGIGDFDNSGREIAEAFTGHESSCEAMHLSAYMLALLAPSANYDWTLRDACRTYLDRYNEFFPHYPTLRGLFADLKDAFTDLYGDGLNTRLVTLMADRRKADAAQERLSKEAAGYSVLPNLGSMECLKPFASRVFGKESQLGKCMHAIAKDLQEERNVVASAHSELEGDDPSDLVDLWWDDMLSNTNVTGPSQLEGAPRKKAANEISKRMDIIAKWLDATNAEESGQVDANLLTDRRKAILGDIASALAPESGDRSLPPVLRWSLTMMRAMLSSNYNTPRPFEDFLITGTVSLDAEGVPIIDPDLADARYYEPWRNVLRHVVGERKSLAESAAAILDPDSDTFDNLGQLEAIGRVLPDVPFAHEVTDEQIREAKASADRELSKFRDDLEIAYLYNQVGEAEKEDLAALASGCQDAFYERHEFGCWRVFLRSLARSVEDSAGDTEDRLTERLVRCKTALGDGGESPLLEEAERLLKTDRNFAVAEDFLNRFEGGERSLTEASNVWFNETDDFAKFIDAEFFSHVLTACEKNRTQTLVTVGTPIVRERMQPAGKAEKETLALLRGWPFDRTRQKDLGGSVASFLVSLGMAVKRFDEVESTDRVKVTLRPSPLHRTEYPHPIKEFGTAATVPITVLLRSGNKTPDSIVADVTKAGSALTIVLLDEALNLSSRRKLAQILHTKSGGMNKFILIDRVLAIYLALFDRPSRLPALLKCSLPFSTFQPFVNGAGVTADEMFCGRKAELETIMDPAGATVVYGGRQLGKTALLMRARDLVHKPDDRQYSAWVDIDECANERDVAAAISEGLAKAIPSWPIGQYETIDALCERIKQVVSSDEVSRILLLIDEADTFLESISDGGYAEIRPMVKTMRETHNAFKFVLAGLHDVCRAKNATSGNGVFGQLSALCVEPLNPVDAMRLLMRPLTYLGFRIERLPHLQTIVTNTNYYPGVIQLFGHELIDSLADGYFDYYGGTGEYPPFTLKREQLGAIISSAKLNREIQRKLTMSLSLDARYFMIARCIALLYYGLGESDGKSPAIHGLRVDDIMKCADDFGVEALVEVSADELEVLLDEMVSMGILAKPVAERRRYRLRRQSFLEIIGATPDDVINDIINAQ